MIERVLKFVEDPRLDAVIASGVLLAASYVVARLVSWVTGRILWRAVRRTVTARDDRLVTALKRSLTHSVFLFGAMAAAAALPVSEAALARILRALVALWIVVTTLTLIRAWKLGLAWTGHERDGTPKAWAKDFGPLLGKVGAVVLAIFGLIGLLESFGVDVNSLVVSLGVGSLAVGLAAQDTLANMFAGFTLMADRPFLIGDRIQLASGETGDVVEIGIRATRIQTPDDTILIVPNGVLTKEKVTNLTRPSRSLTTRVEVGVAYGSDLDEAKRALVEAARASSYVDRDREPVAVVARLGDFGITLRVAFWVRDLLEQGLATSEVLEAIVRSLAEAGIEVAMPVQRVVDGGPAGAVAARRARKEET